MPVPVQTPITPHVGNGVSTVFAFNWHCELDTDMVAKIDGDEVSQSLYTVAGLGNDNGGTVTFVTAPSNLADVVLLRRTEIKRDTNYQTAGDFRAQEVVNPDFDRLWRAFQDFLAGNIGTYFALRVPSGESVDELPPAAERANTLQGYDDAGQPVVVDIPTVPERQLQRETVSVAAGATAVNFPTLTYSRGINSIQVFVNGLKLPASAYTESSSTGVTLVEPLAEAAEVEAVAGAAVNPSVVSDAALVTFTPSGAGSVASNAEAKLREWVSLADKGCVGGVNEATKFQAAIDALPSAGGIILCQNLNYSATVTSGLTAGNKAIVWMVPYGATMPSGLPGMTFNRGRFTKTIVLEESSRDGRIWNHQEMGNVVVAAGEIDRCNYVEAYLPDAPAVSTQRELWAYGFKIGTDHHEPNGGDVRGLKGIVYADGGQANIRGAHIVVEGTDSHTGDITGFLADCFHWDSTDGAYAPVGKAAGFVSQLGAGMQSAYTARSRIDSHFTQKQRPAYGFRVEDGANALLPELANFFGHGGGNGDFFRMAKSDTDSTVVASLDRLAKMLAQNFRSGHATIADDAVLSFTPACTTGFIFVHLEGNSAHWVIRYFRAAAAGGVMTAVASGASGASTTGVLSGTTGVDGNLTISAHTDGLIYIENRSGASRVATYFIVGRS